jgi:hypothetical protein
LNRSIRNISDIAANISAAKNPVADVWRLGLMAVELGTAAVTTIVRLLALGQVHSTPGAQAGRC